MFDQPVVALPHDMVRLVFEGLTNLVWNTQTSLNLTRALPSPLANMFPSLRSLELHYLVVATSWLGELGSLRSLESLRLGFRELTDAATVAAPVRLPSLPSLTHLVVDDWPRHPALQLQLEDLPAVTELQLCGADSRVVVEASQPAPQLRRLTLGIEQGSVDFAALQGLTYASFSTSTQLDGAASIASAAALAYLDMLGEGEWSQSALEVLQNLPSSVSCLSLESTWPQAAMDLVGNLTSIMGLELDYRGRPAAAPLPAEDAPLWEGQRALKCYRLSEEDDKRDLPEVLRQASKLELLQVFFKQPTIQDMDLLTSLPALCKLIIHSGWQASDSLKDATLSLCRRAMPQVEVLDDNFVSCDEDFFRQACCL